MLRKAYQDFGKGDIPAVMQVFDPNIEWVEPKNFPFGGLHKGRDAVAKDVFSKLVETFDDSLVDPKEFIDGGDRIVVLGEFGGTWKTTGKHFKTGFAHVWTIQDGIAKKMVNYADASEIMETMHA